MRARFPQAPEPWIDLSTGINPWPYPLDSPQPEVLQRLPTATATAACRDAMAETFGAPAGSASYLFRAASYSSVSCRHCSDLGMAHGWPLRGRPLPTMPRSGERRDVGSSKHRTPLDALASTDFVVLCNPNNPDGRVWNPDRLEAAQATLAERRGWLIVDEAYADVRPDLSMASERRAGGPHHFTLVRQILRPARTPAWGINCTAGHPGNSPTVPRHLERIRASIGRRNASLPRLQTGSRATRYRLATARVRLDAVLNPTGLRVVGGTDSLPLC